MRTETRDRAEHHNITIYFIRYNRRGKVLETIPDRNREKVETLYNEMESQGFNPVLIISSVAGY